MEILENVTNGSNSTAILEPSVVELITFAALSWSVTVLIVIFIAIFSYLKEEDIWRRLCGPVMVIGVTVIVTAAVLLVAGSVLSTQNGDSTGLSGEGVAGRVLLILSPVIALLGWAPLLAVLVFALHGDDDKCVGACFAVLGIVFGTLFMVGVALLGWSSFEFDTIQGNGSNSTVTPGLHTAGVLLSGVGIGSSFLVVVIFISLLCFVMCFNAYVRRQETKDTRLRNSRSLLEEALKHGYVKCRTVVCLLVGVAGAGKTHTKHLLFGWAPPELRNSTSLAARPIQAIRVRATTQGGQLQEVKPDELDQMLAGTVAKGGVPLERTSFFRSLFCCKCKCFYHQTTSAGISPPSEQLNTTAESSPLFASPHSYGTTESPSSESSKRKCCCCCPLAHSHGSDSEQITKAALDKTIHQIANRFQSQQLSGDWIYLIDSGGQIEFLEVLPAFLQHISVCLFVTNLSEMLSECPKIEYYEDGKPVGKPILCPFTNEQMLMRCVQTISDSSTYQGSKLVMVGTHRDDAHKCLESIEDKNRRLQNKLCPEFDQSLVFHGQEIIFPINAKNPGPQDHRVASEITSMIFDVVSDLEPRKTPISWFKFEQIIQKLARDHGKRILHWRECLSVARLLHLSKKDLDAALDHLASFGVIHYYPHLLPNIVFVNPQFILEKISEVVKFHYKLRHDSQHHTAIRGERRKFINEGCITLELLRKEQFSKDYTDFFTPSDFLKLMKDRLILTDLIGKDEYFMPCLLRTMESQEIDQYRVTSSTSGVAPLAIHFSCKLVPHGVFCSLVALLRSSENSSPWKLFPCPNNHIEPQCLTRNCIKFQLPEDVPGSLTLIDAFSHFEVYVQAEHTICVRLCPSIWCTVVQGIQKAAKTLKYQLVPKQAFLCKHKNTQPHLALPADAVGYWKCELNPDTSGELTDEHKVWKVGETSNTTVGSTTDNSSATTVPPMHSPAPRITLLPSVYQLLRSQLRQQPQTATPSQLQQPRGLVGDQAPRKELHIPMEDREPIQSVQHDLSGAKVKSKLDSPECQAFKRHFAVLSDGISDPGWLAAQLYSRDMISRDMRREAELETTPAPMRTRKLLSAVEDQILTSPTSKFKNLLYILHSEPSLDHLARKLEEAYRAATGHTGLQEPMEEMYNPHILK